jgi:phage terminase large subunit
MTELKISLQPKQKVFLQKVEEKPVTFYGGAKGGGKSKGVRDILLLRRFKFPGTHAGLFRRTYKELEGNHIRPILKEYPDLRPYYNDSKKLLSLPNGSSIEFCHAENEKDVDLYQGREFEDLAIEEAGQWTEAMFKKLLGSNRSSQFGFKPRCLLTGNPGGIGHAWLKRIFIERRFTQFERPDDFAFVQALVTDNQALMENDPDYIHKLESEPNEALRRAYRYGDWDIFAGQFFSEIRREIHLVKPFAIPRHWPRFGAYDYGFNHPAAFGWFACDEDGNVFMYRELIQAQLRVDQFAQKLNEFEDTKELSWIPAGLDCWVTKGTLNNKSAPTIAEEFLSHGIMLSKAKVDRIQGAAQVRSYLAWQGRPQNKPRFYIFETCPITFDCISRMQHDPDRVEDVLKVDATEGDLQSGDDPYDMVRYGLMSRPMIAEQPQQKFKTGTKEWADHQQKRMEESLEREIQMQQAEESESDFWALSSLDLDENPLKHFVNKRRGA